MFLLFGKLFVFIRSILEWSVQWATSLSFRYPLLIAYIAAVAALSAIFYSAILVLLLGLTLVFPSEYIDLVAPFIPSNLHACFSVVLSVRFIVLSLNWTFKFKKELYEMASDAARPR